MTRRGPNEGSVYRLHEESFRRLQAASEEMIARSFGIPPGLLDPPAFLPMPTMADFRADQMVSRILWNMGFSPEKAKPEGSYEEYRRLTREQEARDRARFTGSDGQ